MSVKVTGDPSAELPGSVIGAPIRLPYLMLCTQGEAFCGATWVANSQRELPVKLAERRRHEENCRGGLIVAAGTSCGDPDHKGVEFARDFGDLAGGLPLHLH
jgi:hypothetical protein